MVSAVVENGEAITTFDARLQVYLEPQESIEIGELTAALGAVGHQFQVFVAREALVKKAGEARLLVSSVRPGSIDIFLLPDFASLMLSAPLLGVMINKAELLAKFGKSIKALLDFFKKSPTADPGDDISVRDCEDAINILKPTANHGGAQTFNVHNGDIVVNILKLESSEAKMLMENAVAKRALIQAVDAETRQRVPMMWKRFDRDEAKTTGSSPDKGIIEEIDDKPHAVLFTDNMSSVKTEMMATPFQKVFFVDVEVSRIGGKIVSYRIVGYHGSEEFEQT